MDDMTIRWQELKIELVIFDIILQVFYDEGTKETILKNHHKIIIGGEYEFGNDKPG